MSEPFTILHVEDNPAHREIVRRRVQDVSFSVRLEVADNAEAAMGFLRPRPNDADPSPASRPHLILLDLQFPRRSGHELLAEISSSADLRQIPVVVLTTSDAESDCERVSEHEVYRYLVKPKGFRQLVDIIEEIAATVTDWKIHEGTSSRKQVH